MKKLPACAVQSTVKVKIKFAGGGGGVLLQPKEKGRMGGNQSGTDSLKQDSPALTITLFCG